MSRRIMLGALALALALTAGVGVAARPSLAAIVVGPPWISIEYPANPHDRTTRGAFLLVHAYHHGTPVGFPVSGMAEGIVKGERKSVALSFAKTSREGVYALSRQWGAEGVWTLLVTVQQGENDVAQAMVEIAPTGEVTSVKVPTTRNAEGWNIPRRVSSAEIAASLRARSGE